MSSHSAHGCRIAASLIVLASPSLRAQTPSASALVAALRTVEADQPSPSPRLSSAAVARERRALEQLYDVDSARALWSVEGRLTPQSRAVLAALDASEGRGLVRDDYAPDALRDLATAIEARRATGNELAEFDVRTTRSLARLLWHLHVGRIEPATLHFELPDSHAALDLVQLVVRASRATDAAATIAASEPPYAGYARLLRARYRALASDPTLRPPLPLPLRRAIRPGDQYAGADALRRLLVALGDLAPDVARDAAMRDSASRARLDDDLVEAVRAFQSRHGIDPDGVLGPTTIAQLRVPLARRLLQIDLTLERWRWLPDRAPERFIVVNIPGFRLKSFADDSAAAEPQIAMRVIVGQAHARRHTPIFTGTMRELVFQPYWDVPPSIARGEVIPRIRRQPNYAETEGLEIVSGGDFGARIYPMTEANLERVANGALRIRQRPGARNALGAVKFVFPNDHNVYLHGTPSVELFDRTRRDFSHGCIRVQDPEALAAFVLSDDEQWNHDAIARAMTTGSTQHVRLVRPLQVAILYATAVASDDDVVFFHPDLYDHDASLERALALPPLAAVTVSARQR